LLWRFGASGKKPLLALKIERIRTMEKVEMKRNDQKNQTQEERGKKGF